MKNTYYLVRHGQTVWNTLGQTQGHGNSPLTDLGRSQAKDIAEELKKYPIEMIFTSSLGRAVETASIIGSVLNLPINETDSIKEMGFGIWEGMKLDDIKNKYPETFNTWRTKPEIVSIEGGESLSMVKKRTSDFIEELNEKYEGKHILLVSHAIVVKIMLLTFLNSDVKNIYRIKQYNTALNIIEYGNLGPTVVKMNDTSHLKEDKNNGENKLKSALE